MSELFKPRDTRWWCRVAVLSVLVVFAGMSGAQVPPLPIPPEVEALSAVRAAREQLRLQERERAQAKQLQPAPDVRLETATVPDALIPLPIDEAPCFHVTRLALNGVAAAQFQWALKAAYRPGDPPEKPAPGAGPGRCLGSVSINRIMKRVQNALIERGFITSRVVADPQDLRQGTLALTLVPGRVRAVRFAEGTTPRATQWNAVPARPGQWLNLRDIEQGLENLKRVPTAQVDMQIAPAEGPDAQPGDSDLVIGWKQGRPVRFNLSADDSGTRATGKYQGSATVSVDHGLRLNDLFYLNINHDLGGGDSGARGSKGAALHYSVPLGYWLLAMNVGRSDYNQTVAGENQNYLYSGTNKNRDIQLSRLVYRDGQRKTTVSARGWIRSSKNFIDDTEVQVQGRRMAGWELGVAHREYIGAHTVDTRLVYRRGTGALGSMSAPEEAFGEGTARPRLFTADVQLSSPLRLAGRSLRYSGSWRAQWNRSTLVPQDRFSIGGRYTVRGFDGESVLSAERGWLIRNELGTPLWNTGQEFYLGMDVGRVGGGATSQLAGRGLAGAVLGMRGAYKLMTYDVFAGGPLHKPDGMDASSGVGGFNLGTAF